MKEQDVADGLVPQTKLRRIPRNPSGNLRVRIPKTPQLLRLDDNAIMAVIAKSKRTFHQKHQSSHVQSNGNNNLKHGLNHLTAAKLILVCAIPLRNRNVFSNNDYSSEFMYICGEDSSEFLLILLVYSSEFV